MTSPRSARRSVVRRRRRMAMALGAAVVAVAMAFVVAAVALFAGDDNGGDDSRKATSSGTVAPSASAPSTSRGVAATTRPPPTTASPPVSGSAPSTAPLPSTDVGRTYAVGTRSLSFVDPSRPTSANGSFPGAATRTLPTSFWYPAQGAAGGAPVADAAPDVGHGPYPLVLFAHGYNVTPDFYAPLLERWAAAGYVVAAPTFPILSGDDGGASHVDYEQTWTDSSFVITQVLRLGGGDPLAGLVDRTRIAAAGHSDGEVISFGIGFLACCRDSRIRSVIAMAGDLSNANNPHVRDTGTPILHIMETGDEYDPYDHSIQWDRDNLTAPRWLVSLDSTHVPPYTQPGDPAFELVSRVTVAFLDGTLKGHRDRLGDVTSAVAAQPGVGTLER